jgi:hypothetical protein
MTRRFLKVGLVVAVLAGVVFAAAKAVAHGRRGHHGMMKAMVSAHIDQALDAAKATGVQKAAVNAAADHVFAAFQDGKKDHAAELEQALALFEADKLDNQAIAAHRARHEAEAKKIGDAVVQAVFDAHAALTPPQRRAVVEYVRAHKPAGHDKGLKKAFIKHMIEGRIADALDAIKATAAQRGTVDAAKDRVIAAFEASHQDRPADLERVLALFAADRIDPKQVDALRAEHQDKMRKIADVIVSAVTDVHTSLDSGQRKALAGFVRAHKTHHGRR